MRQIVEEVAGEGLEKFLGDTITVYCSNFIYTGTLKGVNTTCIRLVGARIVYDTGAHDAPAWANAQSLPCDWYIQTSAIESFGPMSKK